MEGLEVSLQFQRYPKVSMVLLIFTLSVVDDLPCPPLPDGKPPRFKGGGGERRPLRSIRRRELQYVHP